MSSDSRCSRTAVGDAPNRVLVEGDHREPVGGLALGRVGHEPDPGALGQRVPVPLLDRPPAGDLARQSLQLPPPDRGEEIAHPVVEAHLPVLVVRRRVARLRREVTGPFDEHGIVGHEHAAATRGHDLVAVEREHPERAEAAGGPPVVRGAQCLGRVLDHRHAVASRTTRGSGPSRRTARRDRRPRSRPAGGRRAPARPAPRRGARGRGSRWPSSLSRNTGRAPTYMTALAVATNVSVGTSTSSPGPTPSRSNASWSAAVPLDNAAACSTPTNVANSRSNASTCGPSGAIQLESNVSSNSARSAAPTSGGDRKSRVTGARYQRSSTRRDACSLVSS